MSAGVRYDPDESFVHNIKREEGTVSVLDELTDEALRHAQEGSPEVTGRYRRGLRVEHGAGGEPPRLVTDSPFWHFIEFGTVHNAPHAPLRRAVEATGLEFTDHGAGGE